MACQRGFWLNQIWTGGMNTFALITEEDSITHKSHLGALRTLFPLAFIPNLVQRQTSYSPTPIPCIFDKMSGPTFVYVCHHVCNSVMSLYACDCVVWHDLDSMFFPTTDHLRKSSCHFDLPLKACFLVC